VANIMRIPVIVVVDPKLPVQDASPSSGVRQGEPGQGVVRLRQQHRARSSALRFAKRTGLDVITVPYKSSPQAVTDVVSGQVS
jgi:tripartite-type tricarboxylate transporter receptor subunit TctC